MSNGNRLEQQVALLDAAAAAVAARGRTDLAARLAASRRAIGDPAVRVVVAGEFKMGKSALVNALLESPVCPVDEDLATAVPTLVRWAATPEAHTTARSDSIGAEPIVLAIAYDDRADYCSEAGNHDNDRGLQLVELGLPAPMLAAGMQLVDTPGVGGLASVHNAATVAALPAADAVLFVSDAAAGAERSRARLPAGRVLRMPRRHRGREQDRLPACVATHRRARPRSPRSSRPFR